MPPLPQEAVQATQMSLAPATARSSDTNRAPGGMAQTSRPSMVTAASDINAGPDCCGTMDPDMALSCRSGLNVAMAPGSSVGHSDLHGPGYSMASRLQPSHKLQSHFRVRGLAAAGICVDGCSWCYCRKSQEPCMIKSEGHAEPPRPGTGKAGHPSVDTAQESCPQPSQKSLLHSRWPHPSTLVWENWP